MACHPYADLIEILHVSSTSEMYSPDYQEIVKIHIRSRVSHPIVETLLYRLSPVGSQTSITTMMLSWTPMIGLHILMIHTY
jgi:hypothetical protein